MSEESICNHIETVKYRRRLMIKYLSIIDNYYPNADLNM